MKTGLSFLLLAAVAVGLFLYWKAKEPVVQAVPTTVPPQTTVPETMQPLPPETLPPETLPPETEPEKVTIDAVPLYFQTDYPHTKYGGNTVATSGCSIACLAMVASYLTDQEYTPAQMAWYFGDYGHTNIERLEYGTERMGLPCEKNFDFRLTLEGLQQGKVAIIMVNERSPFTGEQHFLVLTGLTERGKILVHDPMEDHYEDPYLQKGFAEGFEQYDITRGYSGGWVYDKSAMPEEALPYTQQSPLPTRYAEYRPDGEDTYLLACYAWAIAREESEQVQQAVLEAVLNRIPAEGYPNTVSRNLSQPDLYHYAMYQVEEPDLAQYRAANAALYGPHILPEDVVRFSTKGGQYDVWGRLGKFTFYY